MMWIYGSMTSNEFGADAVRLFRICILSLIYVCVCVCVHFRDLAVIVAAIAYNTWFTKLHCKDMRLVTAFSFPLRHVTR